MIQCFPGAKATMTDLYNSYSSFKGWGDTTPSVPPEEFEEILALGKCKPSARILEIGFGSGQFLDWARGAGHEVVGIEIIPEMITAATSRGHIVYQNPGSEIDGLFDLIVAIDVLEHIPHDDLVMTLSRCRRWLAPDGCLVARFPNGDSPFSARYQNGDATHLKPLTASSLAQIAAPVGMRLAHAGNSRALPKNLSAALKRRLIYTLRDMAETVIGRLYYSSRVPMDPNILVVMIPAG
jgi:SAM-dependent methyltransferase